MNASVPFTHLTMYFYKKKKKKNLSGLCAFISSSCINTPPGSQNLHNRLKGLSSLLKIMCSYSKNKNQTNMASVSSGLSRWVFVGGFCVRAMPVSKGCQNNYLLHQKRCTDTKWHQSIIIMTYQVKLKFQKYQLRGIVLFIIAAEVFAALPPDYGAACLMRLWACCTPQHSNTKIVYVYEYLFPPSPFFFFYVCSM